VLAQKIPLVFTISRKKFTGFFGVSARRIWYYVAVDKHCTSNSKIYDGPHREFGPGTISLCGRVMGRRPVVATLPNVKLCRCNNTKSTAEEIQSTLNSGLENLIHEFGGLDRSCPYLGKISLMY
jgi:hypothetical protein